MNIFLRRKGLGKTSCEKVSQFMRDDHNKEIEVVRNDNLNLETRYDVAIRWGCTSTLNSNIIINPAVGIHMCDNKATFREILRGNDVSIPRSFFTKEEIYQEKDISFPLIGREMHHSQGKNIKVINSIEDLENDLYSAYWSEFIDKEMEFRVYCFFGKVIAVAEKIPTEKGRKEIAWNHATGGSVFENVKWGNWPLVVCKEALKAYLYNRINFCGIDVMYKDGKAFILESNSAPSLTSEYRQRCHAKGFSWMLNIIEKTGEKPETFDFPKKINSYSDVIHPALIS